MLKSTAKKMKKNANDFHENLFTKDYFKKASNQTFGKTFSIVFFLLAIINRASLPLGLSFLLLAAGIAIVTWKTPNLLTGINSLWNRLSYLLSKILNPVFLFVLYYLFFSPMALIIRLFKPDLLGLNFDSKSFWIDSEIPKSTIKDQF